MFSAFGLLFITHMGGRAPDGGVAVLLMPPPFILIVNAWWFKNMLTLTMSRVCEKKFALSIIF
jgi:hypothetical protein